MDTAQNHELVAVGSNVTPDELQLHTRYPLLRAERFPEAGLQVMILGNLSRELFDREIMIFIPISVLNQNFTDLLNRRVLYCDVAYEGLNNQDQYILEISRMNLPPAERIAVPTLRIRSLHAVNYFLSFFVDGNIQSSARGGTSPRHYRDMAFVYN